jgi:hypothetical protein
MRSQSFYNPVSGNPGVITGFAVADIDRMVGRVPDTTMSGPVGVVRRLRPTTAAVRRLTDQGLVAEPDSQCQ